MLPSQCLRSQGMLGLGIDVLALFKRRYSAFIPLYPVGMFLGEMPLMYNGIPYLRQRGLHSLSMPNSLNFAFRYDIFVQARAPACGSHHELLGCSLLHTGPCMHSGHHCGLPCADCPVRSVAIGALQPVFLHAVTAEEAGRWCRKQGEEGGLAAQEVLIFNIANVHVGCMHQSRPARVCMNVR